MFGYEQPYEEGKLISANTKFLIGSISKPFKALAIKQLEDAKSVSVSEKVCRSLEEFCAEDGVTIRVLNLLEHTSGLGGPTYSWREKFHEYMEGDHKTLSGKEALRRSLAARELLDVPKRRFKYANLNYIPLWAMIEGVTGKILKDCIQQKIFDPLIL